MGGVERSTKTEPCDKVLHIGDRLSCPLATNAPNKELKIIDVTMMSSVTGK